MSVHSEMLGGEHEFTWNGKTYKIGLVTQDVKVAFEKALFSKAKDAAKELRDIMDREEYAAHLKDLTNDYIQGKFSLVSERGMESLQGPQGGTLLFSLIMGITEMEFLRLISDPEAQAELVPLLHLAMHESFPGRVQAPEKKGVETPPQP